MNILNSRQTISQLRRLVEKRQRIKPIYLLMALFSIALMFGLLIRLTNTL